MFGLQAVCPVVLGAQDATEARRVLASSQIVYRPESQRAVASTSLFTWVRRHIATATEKHHGVVAEKPGRSFYSNGRGLPQLFWTGDWPAGLVVET
jgi:hypothetical protein